MKRLVFIVLTMTVFFSCDIKRKDKIADDAAKKFEQALKDTTEVQLIDSVYNFGKVTEGSKVEYNFRFKNIGKKPLLVTNATASCGCTVPEKPEKPIMPGEVGFIKVVFNSKNKIGHNEKTIMVAANVNPEFPEMKLIGEVEAK